jgi:hypothetical protein
MSLLRTCALVALVCSRTMAAIPCSQLAEEHLASVAEKKKDYLSLAAADSQVVAAKLVVDRDKPPRPPPGERPPNKWPDDPTLRKAHSKSAQEWLYYDEKVEAWQLEHAKLEKAYQNRLGLVEASLKYNDEQKARALAPKPALVPVPKIAPPKPTVYYQPNLEYAKARIPVLHQSGARLNNKESLLMRDHASAVEKINKRFRNIAAMMEGAELEYRDIKNMDGENPAFSVRLADFKANMIEIKAEVDAAQTWYLYIEGDVDSKTRKWDKFIKNVLSDGRDNLK